MKRIILATTIVFLLGTALLWLAAGRSLSITTGYYLTAENGAHLLISNNTPIQLSDKSKSESLFDGLASGDRIFVLHDGIAESYPARTGAYAVFRQRQGTTSDVPQEVIDQLAELGWVIVDATPSVRVLTDREFTASVSWANYAEGTALYATVLNRSRMAQSSIRHLPLWQVSNTAELAGWQETFGDLLSLEQGYDEIPSFASVTAEMGESFFREQSVLLVYVPSNSCTYRYIVNSVDLCAGQLCVHVQQANDPEAVDCAMAGWLMVVTVPKEMLQGITDFDADLNNLKD